MNHTSPADATKLSSGFGRFSFSLRDAGTLIGLIVILAVFAAIVPGFISERNLVKMA